LLLPCYTGKIKYCSGPVNWQYIEAVSADDVA